MSDDDMDYELNRMRSIVMHGGNVANNLGIAIDQGIEAYASFKTAFGQNKVPGSMNRGLYQTANALAATSSVLSSVATISSHVSKILDGPDWSCDTRDRYDDEPEEVIIIGGKSHVL